MAGSSSPSFLPPPTTSPRNCDDLYGSREQTPLPDDPVLRRESPNLATEHRVGSPLAVTSPITIGTSTSAGFDEDIEMCDVDDGNSDHQAEGIDPNVRAAIDNIRESVKYIRSSVSRKQMFEEIIAREGIKCKKKPGLDIVTRWNSTLSMLATALEYRVAFDKLKAEDQKYTYAPSSDEWERAGVLCWLLEVFKDATEVISGSQYPTSNLYFHIMRKIKLTLEEESSVAGAEIATVLEEMKKKFNKYWNKSYVLLCVPVVFDPRFKLKFIDFLFNESFTTKAKQRFDRVEKLARQLFSAYSSQEKESVVGSIEEEPDLGAPSVKNDPWAAWD